MMGSNSIEQHKYLLLLALGLFTQILLPAATSSVPVSGEEFTKTTSPDSLTSLLGLGLTPPQKQSCSLPACLGSLAFHPHSALPAQDTEALTCRGRTEQSLFAGLELGESQALPTTSLPLLQLLEISVHC